MTLGVGSRGGNGGDITVNAVDIGAGSSRTKSEYMSGHWLVGLGGNDGHSVEVWLRPGCTKWTPADKVKDVHCDTTSWFLDSGLVGVMRFKVAIKYVVVPIALEAGGAGLREL